MANDVLSVSVPMNNARFGRLLSDEEMAELERRQRHYDARERATAAGLPPPTLDYDGNPMTVMKAWDERKAAERAAAMANLASGQGGQGDVDARLATPETSPLFTVGQMAGAPAALVSTATGLATMAKEVKDGRPETFRAFLRCRTRRVQSEGCLRPGRGPLTNGRLGLHGVRRSSWIS